MWKQGHTPVCPGPAFGGVFFIAADVPIATMQPLPAAARAAAASAQAATPELRCREPSDGSAVGPAVSCIASAESAAWVSRTLTEVRIPSFVEPVTAESEGCRCRPMKEVSLLEMIGRSLAKVAAGAGIAALLIWLTYVMLDFGHMQSGFTLPQSRY